MILEAPQNTLTRSLQMPGTIAGEFPEGWAIHLIRGNNNLALEIKLVGDSNSRMPVVQVQTAEYTQKLPRQMRKALEGHPVI